MQQKFIIPQTEKSILATIENNQIVEIKKTDIRFASENIITDNNLIASLCFNSKRHKKVKVYDFEGKVLFNKKSNFKVLAQKDNVVYLGGVYKSRGGKIGEIFSILDLNKEIFEIKNIPLPIEVHRGKSIDDVIVYGDTLILVDNIIFPKYLFKYDISIPANPKHIETINLPNNGSYEHIIKGEANEDWLILLSSTFGMNGGAIYINISGKTNGRIAINFLLNETSDSFILDDYFSVDDICLINNLLYIVRDYQLYYIDLNKEISIENMVFVKTKLTQFNRLLKTPNNELIVFNNEEFELVHNL